MEKLKDQIGKVLLTTGCDMVGVANVERFTGAPEGRRPIDILPTARSVIVGAVGKRQFKISAKSRPKRVREMKSWWAGAKW